MLYPGSNSYGNTKPIKCFGSKDDFDGLEMMFTSFIMKYENDESMKDDVRTAYRFREKIQEYMMWTENSSSCFVQLFEREAEDLLAFFVKHSAIGV